ncbi:MAG TPA: Rid family detoxifying hydrolase [Steroidobacteraceae bacterium]|nr:Rid family detoxifying hydrolase [Steroidobacteraceae bacterium]
MKKEAIAVKSGRPPVGPFSAAIRADNLIFVSGQVGLDPATGKLVERDIEKQTEQVFANLKAVLDACGKTFDDAVRIGVYLTDMNHFTRMNAIYAKHFNTPYPARTTIGVAALPLGAMVEIDMWVA